MIPHADLGNVMASRESNPATMRSDISPTHDVPHATDNESEPDAGQITPKGLHAQCPYCPYTKRPKYWTRVDHYHAHIRIDHPDERIPDPDGYTCPCHGREFSSRWEMTRHTNGRLRVPCQHCGRPLTKASMARHLIRCVHAEPDIQKHECKICNRVFTSTLGTHTRFHSPLNRALIHTRQVYQDTRALHTQQHPLHKFQ